MTQGTNVLFRLNTMVRHFLNARSPVDTTRLGATMYEAMVAGIIVPIAQ